MRSARSILVSALAVVLTAGLVWSGREAGKRMARAGWLRSDEKERKVATLPVSRPSPSRATIEDTKAVANALRRLKFLSESSFYLKTDWEALEELQKILAGLSSAELASVFAGLGKELSGSLVEAEVLRAWVRLDPAAALIGARSYAQKLFASWAGEDTAAALDWLESDGFPAILVDQMDSFRAAALSGLAERDFDLASAEFLKLPPGISRWGWNGRDQVMRGWASAAVEDPELREKLVAFAKATGRPEDHAQMNDTLMRAWPQEDALGMLTYIHELRDYMESSAIPAEKRPAMDAMAVGAAIYREYDRPALEWWMERYSDRKEVPGSLQDALIQWRRKNAQVVEQWFAEQPPSPQRDAMQASLIPTMIAAGKMDEAVKAIETIDDAELRQSAIERLDYVWSKRDPAAAAAWRGTE